MEGTNETSGLRAHEQEKYDAAKDAVDLGCTDTAIRRGKARLGCTRKTFLKYLEWYKSGDLSRFSHGNKGKQPATTVDAATRELVVKLYREQFSNASYTHFAEILREDHGIDVSDGTLHAILKGVLLVSPCSRKATKRRIEKDLRSLARKENLSKGESEHVNSALSILDGDSAHPRRPRRKYFGEMVQMDASEYVWVKGAGKWHLHVAVDDATSEVVGAWFDLQETLRGYFRVLYMILILYGIPSLFRTDRRTVFEYKLLGKPDEEKDTYTQFAGACRTLGIELEATSVPEHKGRVERMNRTLQTRVPVELARHGVTTIEEANAFLWEYLPIFNAQFSLKDEKDLEASTFLKSPPEDEVNIILAVVSHRTIDSGCCIKYHNGNYCPCATDAKGQLRQRHFLKGTKVLVIEAFDGTLLANIKEEIFILTEVAKRSAYSKEFDPEPAPKEKKQYVPGPDHPWRTKFLTSRVLETHIAKPKEEYEA